MSAALAARDMRYEMKLKRGLRTPREHHRPCPIKEPRFALNAYRVLVLVKPAARPTHQKVAGGIIVEEY
jgi:hypothetical protein